GNADQLGGAAAADYQKQVRWAIVKADGTIAAQSGGISNTFHDPITCNSGCDFLNFGSSQANKAIVVTPNSFPPKTQVAAALGGGTSTPGGVWCAAVANVNDTNHVLVETANENGTNTDAPYYIAVIG